jgi:TetR/AcrR family transcriptional regulator, regulator of cefoperazone and chloramphenicol sensitivity
MVRPKLVPDDTRTKLLKAAVAVFSERGYDKATIREICRKAGANVALVNYHFGDKLELYVEVIRYATDAAAKMELLNQALGRHADPCDALRQIIAGIIERLGERREQSSLHLGFMLREMAQPTPALSRVIDETIRPLYDRLRSLIGRILNLPIDHPTTRLCTHSIIGQVSHYAHARPILAQVWPAMKLTSGQRKLVANHIADFSLAYLTARRGAHSAARRHK